MAARDGPRAVAVDTAAVAMEDGRPVAADSAVDTEAAVVAGARAAVWAVRAAGRRVDCRARDGRRAVVARAGRRAVMAVVAADGPAAAAAGAVPAAGKPSEPTQEKKRKRMSPH